MKVKDLVKGKIYKVFDYNSFSWFSYCLGNYNNDNCFVPAVYIGRLNGYHWFDELNGYDICRYFADEIHFGQVMEVEENECD